MKFSIYTGVYALTLLISAALLFSIQPMFSKMILPLLGGTPQVWNTAMVFFQVTLLAGYAYAHATTRFFGIRTQAIVHIFILIAFASILPFLIPEGEVPPVDKDPTLWQLMVMATIIGGPFFVLSGSAPMFQRWFSETDHPDSFNPYFLYGASNLGSMTSLLAYPFLIEPYLPLDAQSNYWMYGYFLLIFMSVLSAAMIWVHGSRQKAKERPAQVDEHITWKRRGFWVLTAFLPSSLMLGVTTFITTDIASAPLLWILPLAMYVGTFILVFARKTLLNLKQITVCFSIAMAVMLTFSISSIPVHSIFFVAMHLAVFFFAAMLCHTHLAQARPRASHLTEFYLLMSIGGALGGIFNAIIAPQYFIIPLEYALILFMILLLRYSSDPDKTLIKRFQNFRERVKTTGSDPFFDLPVIGAIGISFLIVFLAAHSANATGVYGTSAFLILFLLTLRSRWPFLIACFVVIFYAPPGYNWNVGQDSKILYRDRNFFGVMRIFDYGKDERAFLHGTTNHGTQPLDEAHRMTPISYYSKNSPINDAFDILDKQSGPQNIGVVGLGIGVTACFTKEGRSYDFYEIDPDVAAIAQNTRFFTYLSDCGSPYQIILGDGRLTIENTPDNKYDMIFIDAYSSDNIPVHLITLEALTTYLDKIKQNGLLIFNISNKYVDIEPVLHEAAKAIGIMSVAKVSMAEEIEGTNLQSLPTHFVAFSQNEAFIDSLKNKGWSATMPRTGVKTWTDQYSNIFSVLGNDISMKRIRALQKEKRENETTSNENIDTNSVKKLE